MISEDDVRAMVRLLGEVAALPGGHAEKKRHLMDGLCRMIGGDAWVWGQCVEMVKGELPIYVNVLHGGMTERQFSGFLEITSHPEEGRMLENFVGELQTAGVHLTRNRLQIDPEDLLETATYRHLWIKAGLYPGIISARPLDQTSLSVIGIFRKPGSEEVTLRESRIAHIILTEVPWLHEQGWPEDRGVTVPRLSPRQRMVLNLLLQGQSRKGIADSMGISLNTVGGYVKAVYRHLDVQSHAELMRRFMMGDGGDTP